MSEVVMPRLSDSMEEGTILKWLKGSGEATMLAITAPIARVSPSPATICKNPAASAS
jgi:hypothetical protein